MKQRKWVSSEKQPETGKEFWELTVATWGISLKKQAKLLKEMYSEYPKWIWPWNPKENRHAEVVKWVLEQSDKHNYVSDALVSWSTLVPALLNIDKHMKNIK